MKQEEWINKITDSLQNKAEAEPPASLRQRVAQKIAARQKAPAKVIAMKWVAATAVAACMLLVFNWWAISAWQKHTTERTATVSDSQSLTPNFSIDNN